jgi:hypothetical protein
MTTPSTTIKFSDIQTEFTGSNPISLSEYYKAELGTPVSGQQISASALRGKTRQGNSAECAAAVKRDVSTLGLFYDPTTVGPLCRQTRIANGGEMGTPTFSFTPSALIDDNVKNCVNNTVIWYGNGDGLGARGLSNFKINGVAVTPTISCNTNDDIPTGNNAQSRIDANIYGCTFGATARVTTITSASCTFPTTGRNSQCIGGAFLLPGTWGATVICGNATALQPGTFTTTLLANDVVVMNYFITVDPNSTPSSIAVLNLVSGTTQLAAHYNYISKWYGISGIAVYTCAVAGTYTLPVTTTTYGANEPLYKQAVRLRFVPEYVGQA